MRRTRFKIIKRRVAEPGDLFLAQTAPSSFVIENDSGYEAIQSDPIPDLVAALFEGAPIYYARLLREELEKRGLEIVVRRG